MASDRHISSTGIPTRRLLQESRQQAETETQNCTRYNASTVCIFTALDPNQLTMPALFHSPGRAHFTCRVLRIRNTWIRHI